MRKLIAIVMLSSLLALLLAACGGGQPAAGSGAAQAVQKYLQGVVDKKVEVVSSLSCKEWEQSAIQELDSLQAVKAELQGVSCQQSGTDGQAALVKCQGKIVITYNTEKQQLDLSLRTYRVVQSGSDWRMCGYQQ
jgi:hypothetical protein